LPTHTESLTISYKLSLLN